jgi:hypothetical protein
VRRSLRMAGAGDGDGDKRFKYMAGTPAAMHV